MSPNSFVDSDILEKVRIGREYVEAKFGFRNHWYPALLSNEIGEGEVVPIELLGEKIILRRIDGRLFGLRDFCVHRGVQLSKKIECYTKQTITCWYHGFTYRFSDGVLDSILGVGESAAIGNRKIKTYPVEEAKGMVFVFVGDDDFETPPLANDVPPGFLDDELVVRGLHRIVNANWRIGVENGFDSTHIFIHKDAMLLEDNDLALPLGLVPAGRSSFKRVDAEGAPKGVYDLFGEGNVIPVFEGRIDGEVVLTGRPEGKTVIPSSISMWLPGVLCVEPWPDPELTQLEWYVPVDGDRHIYFQAIGRRCKTANEEAAFHRAYERRWETVALRDFNDDDIWAREAMMPFYGDDTGWLREQLFECDGNIIEWRRLASKHNRGIQRPEHLR
jgi:carbazole 1,9a-dioxygenase terminal dioxygenase component